MVGIRMGSAEADLKRHIIRGMRSSHLSWSVRMLATTGR